MIYVGEGDPVRPRLEQHHREKDFWTSVVLFTSSAENLNKAHVQYLESRLIEFARTAKRCDLENGNMPQRPNLTEADQAEMESFLDDMLLVYPVVGLNVFEAAKIEAPTVQRLIIKAKGITAVGYDTPAGFVVTRGSEAVIDWVPSAYKYALTLRDTLVDRGVLVKSNDHYVFTQDYTFDSPSAAAQIVQGRTANGQIDWKDEQGTDAQRDPGALSISDERRMTGLAPRSSSGLFVGSSIVSSGLFFRARFWHSCIVRPPGAA